MFVRALFMGLIQNNHFTATRTVIERRVKHDNLLFSGTDEAAASERVRSGVAFLRV